MADGDSLFRPVDQKRASDDAVRQIMESVESGRLRPGDKLPGERDLTRQLSISRTTVREAIRLLEARGILEVRPGAGTFVTRQTHIPGLSARWSAWLMENGHRVLDLLEVRSVLEPLATALTTVKATPDEIQTLWVTLGQIDTQLAEGNSRAAADGDVRFHQLISEFSGNSFLIELNEGINISLIENRYAYYSIPGRGEGSNRQHREIVKWIEASDSEAASAAMRQHIEDSITITRELIAKLIDNQLQSAEQPAQEATEEEISL